MMTLTCGATVISLVGLTKVVYSNPNIGGNGNMTFIYAGAPSVTLLATAVTNDVQDALAGLPILQSLVALSQFPSTIA